MYYESLTQQFPKTLNNLARILDKAAAYADTKKFDVEVLLNARLAPDQFHLIRQVQIACDVAKMSAARLTGKEAPSHEDNEKTLADLKNRIQKVTAYLATFKPSDFEGASERRITQPRWEAKSLSGADYFSQWALPNLYFHVSTAYSILRTNGVDVGKKDFLGELPFRGT